MANRTFAISPLTLYDVMLNKPSAFIGVNVLGEITYATAAIYDVLGWTPEELQDKPLITIIPERLRQRHLASFTQAVKTSKLKYPPERPLRTSALHKDGTEIPVELTLSLFRTDDGDLRILGMIRDIRDFIELEEEGHQLRAELRYARSLTANLGEGVIATDSAGIIRVVNHVALDLLGYEEEGMLGKSGHELLHCYTPEGVYRESQSCPILLTGKDGQVCEVDDDYFVRKDKSFINVRFVSAPILIGKDSVGTVVAFHDITEAKRQRQITEESEERYRRLVEFSPDAIVVYTGPLIVYANQAALDLVGAKNNDQILHKSALDFIHPSYRQTAAERMTRVMKDRQTLPPLHEQILRLDGSVVDVEIASMPVVYDGKGSALAVVRDVSYRYQVESGLNNEEVRNILETMDALVSVFTEGGRVLYRNKAWDSFSGLEGESLYQKRLWEFEVEPQKFQSALQQATQTRQPFMLEVRLIGKSKFPRWFMLRCRPLDGGSAWVAVATDIDDQKRLNEYAQRLINIVESSNSAVIGTDTLSLINFWNKAAEEMFGWGMVDVIGKPITTVIPEGTIQSIIESTAGVPFSCTKKDGTSIQASIQSTPTYNPLGEVIGTTFIGALQ